MNDRNGTDTDIVYCDDGGRPQVEDYGNVSEEGCITELRCIKIVRIVVCIQMTQFVS
jgi:hypothetical protein